MKNEYFVSRHSASRKPRRYISPRYCRITVIRTTRGEHARQHQLRWHSVMWCKVANSRLQSTKQPTVKGGEVSISLWHRDLLPSIFSILGLANTPKTVIRRLQNSQVPASKNVPKHTLPSSNSKAKQNGMKYFVQGQTLHLGLSLILINTSTSYALQWPSRWGQGGWLNYHHQWPTREMNMLSWETS